MLVRAIHTRLFKEREDLADFIVRHLPKLEERSVLVVTSKIMALAEGRTASPALRESLIRSESDVAIPTAWVWLTLKDGAVSANAGIDESNADGTLILLPKDPFKSATRLRTELMRRYHVKDLAVLVTDSRIYPLSAGITGAAIGYAGMKGLRDYRRKKDLYGRPFKFETVSVADSLAAAAVLLMGEGDESKPLAVIEDAPVEFTERTRKGELKMPPEDDLFAPLLGKLKRR